jgi:hypothetical protein
MKNQWQRIYFFLFIFYFRKKTCGNSFPTYCKENMKSLMIKSANPNCISQVTFKGGEKMNLPKAAPGVMIKQGSDSSYVVNMITGKIYTFNETALAMLRACQEGITEEELVNKLVESEDERPLVEEDVKKTLKLFSELNLVE